MGAVVVVGEAQGGAVGRQQILDRGAPFDDDEVLRILEIFGEIVSHQTGVGETIKIVMNELAVAGQGVGFGDGETGAGDGFGGAQRLGETTGEGGFAGADVADQFEDGGGVVSGVGIVVGWVGKDKLAREIGAKVEHG